jgi:hypothetical protein
LNGTDPFIDDGTVEGVFREGNMLTAQGSSDALRLIYGKLRKNMPAVLREARSRTPYSARVFAIYA